MISFNFFSTSLATPYLAYLIIRATYKGNIINEFRKGLVASMGLVYAGHPFICEELI